MKVPLDEMLLESINIPFAFGREKEEERNKLIMHSLL
jgi:hypothetical protein